MGNAIIKSKYDNQITEIHTVQNPPLNNEDIMIKYGMFESGTTGHSIAVNAKVKNIKPTNTSLNIIIPDGNTMESTHESDLYCTLLPQASRVAHIVTQLQ